MDVETIVVTVIAAVASLIVGFVAGQFSSLKARIEASPQKWDDALLDVAERIAARISQAKAEDPKTPLGTGS